MGLSDKGLEECEGMIESFKRRMKDATGRDLPDFELRIWLETIIRQKIEKEFTTSFTDQTLGTLLNCMKVIQEPQCVAEEVGQSPEYMTKAAEASAKEAAESFKKQKRSRKAQQQQSQ